MDILNLNMSCLESVILNGTDESLQYPPINIPTWPLFVFFISISSLFLLINLVIYVLIWEDHNVHQWIQTAYLISLLLFNLVFIPALTPAISQAGTSELKRLCYLLALLNQFFFIFSKTWLLIISFDILSTLWKFEPSPGLEKNRKTFRLYIFFSFLVPTVFACTGVALNVLHRGLSERNSNDGELWVKFPDYGHRHCRIPNWDIWEYFVFTNCAIHLVMLVLIISIIAFHLYEGNDAKCGSVNQRNYESIFVFLRLVIVVGVSWSYIAVQDMLNAGNINTTQGTGWHIFRAIFFLQGVFVTLVYVGNRNTLGPLARKYPALNKFQVDLKNLLLCHNRDKRNSVSTITSNL